MSDERSTFEVTRARLEDIVTQVRRKDVSLEQSLDLLEEAVRLVNQCNELIDQTSFRPVTPEGGEGVESPAGPGVDVALQVTEVVAVSGEGTVGIAEVLETGNTGEPSDQWGSVDAWSDDEVPTEAGGLDETDDGASASGPVEIEDDERE